MGCSARAAAVLLLLCLVVPKLCAIRWLGIGVEEGTPWNKTDCNKRYGFAGKQYGICRHHLPVMEYVSEAVAMTKDECKLQMANRRWNCSSIDRAPTYTNDLKRGTKESAFLYALASAALTYSVTQACSIARLPGICGCGSIPKLKLENDSWLWGGCSDNIAYGARFSKRFTDALETKRMKRIESADRALMNLHNNEAGRRLVRNKMETLCRCHGTSGSCQTKTCFRRLPSSFSSVAQILKQRIDKAVHVVNSKKGRNKQQLKATQGERYSKDDLLSLESSPSYCNVDIKRGSLGTRGRECNPDIRGKGSCSYMCCGRKVRSFKRTVEERCNCRYIWCCYVKCSTCVKTTVVSVCAD